MLTHKPIFQLCPRLSSGGIERGTVDVALKLKAEHLEPIVISGGGRLVNELTHAGIEHITLPLFRKLPWQIKETSHQLTKLIQARQPALIHARSRAPIWAAHLACNRTCTPLITSCHSPHSGGFLGLKHYYNKVITLGDRIIATSSFIKDYLMNSLNTPADKIDIIHRGINLCIFDPRRFKQEDIEKAYQRYHLPKNKKIICLAGRITRWKGQDILLQALHQLNDPSLHAIIVGRVDSVNYFKSLTQTISENNLQNQVTIIPESSELPLLYALSDIALSTSRKPEAFGRVAVEAQAMGCLTIATNLGAAKETVINNQTGWLIQPDNPDALAKQVKVALSLNATEKERIASAAHTHIANQFNQQQMLSKTLAVYAPYLNR